MLDISASLDFIAE